MALKRGLSTSSAILLVGRQSAVDVAPVSGVDRIQKLAWIDGDLSSSTETVSQEVFDGEVYSTPREEVARFEGSGELTILADAVSLPLLLQGLLGPDTHTGALGAIQTHVAHTDNPGSNPYFTFGLKLEKATCVSKSNFVMSKLTV